MLSECYSSPAKARRDRRSRRRRRKNSSDVATVDDSASGWH